MTELKYSDNRGVWIIEVRIIEVGLYMDTVTYFGICDYSRKSPSNLEHKENISTNEVLNQDGKKSTSKKEAGK